MNFFYLNPLALSFAAWIMLLVPSSILMREILERKQAHPYESDADKADEEIVEGLMEITAHSLTNVTTDEPAYE